MKINWIGVMVLVFLICGLFTLAIIEAAREILQDYATRRKRLDARPRG